MHPGSNSPTGLCPLTIVIVYHDIARLSTEHLKIYMIENPETAQERNQGGVRYARNESFSNQIDKVLNNRLKNIKSVNGNCSS